LAWGSLVSAAFTFLPCRPIPGPTPPTTQPITTRSPRSWWCGTSMPVAACRSHPTWVGQPYLCAWMSSGEASSIFSSHAHSPSPSPLCFHTHARCSTRHQQPPPSHLCAVRPGHKEHLDSVTFCTEFLHGAPATEAWQRSSLCRHLAPHELTANCHATSSRLCFDF
jgi:hypothetical protein